MLFQRLYIEFVISGSDSGGSIRNPAHNCGIVGLKPTSGRLPLAGQALAKPCIPEILNATGFFTRTVEDQECIYNILLAEENLHINKTDSRFVPIPWRTVPNDKKLVFGWCVFLDFEFVLQLTKFL